MSLYESAEMYLETIYQLSRTSPAVRSIDVAQAMGYSRPSVSRAVNLLKKDGYLEMDADGFLVLTVAGKEIACKIFDRHNVLTEALVRLGVDRDTAAEDACRIEHVISDRSFYTIKAHLQHFSAEAEE